MPPTDRDGTQLSKVFDVDDQFRSNEAEIIAASGSGRPRALRPLAMRGPATDRVPTLVARAVLKAEAFIDVTSRPDLL